MAILGRRIPEQAALHTREAGRRVLAGSAMHRIRPDETGAGEAPPFRGEEAGEGFSVLRRWKYQDPKGSWCASPVRSRTKALPRLANGRTF